MAEPEPQANAYLLKPFLGHNLPADQKISFSFRHFFHGLPVQLALYRVPNPGVIQRGETRVLGVAGKGPTAVIAKNGGWIVVGHHIAGTAGYGQRQSSDHDNTHRLNSVVPICLQYTRAQGYRPASVSQVSKR